MASLLSNLMNQMSGTHLDQLSQQLGVDRKQAQTGIAAALPMLLSALSRNTTTTEGAQALNAALDRDHDGSILGNLGGFLSQGDANPGAAILKHVLGGKQTQVQSGLSRATGMNAASTGKLLAMLAPVVLGALGQAKRQNNLDASQLAGVLGQERDHLAQQAPKQFGALNSLLDADGDGDVDLSDLVKGGGGLLGKLFGNR
jgi:hypothetical protein